MIMITPPPTEGRTETYDVGKAWGDMLLGMVPALQALDPAYYEKVLVELKAGTRMVNAQDVSSQTEQIFKELDSVIEQQLARTGCISLTEAKALMVADRQGEYSGVQSILRKLVNCNDAALLQSPEPLQCDPEIQARIEAILGPKLSEEEKQSLVDRLVQESQEQPEQLLVCVDQNSILQTYFK